VLCSTFTPQLFTVDETTGAATPLGNPVQSGTGTPLAANEDSPAGLAFDSEGNLFLSLGFRDGRILGIDLAPSPPEYVELGQATEGGSVSDIVALPEPGLGSLRLAGLAALLGIARRRRTGARRSSP
jgi:hypothetical protein